MLFDTTSVRGGQQLHFLDRQRCSTYLWSTIASGYVETSAQEIWSTMPGRPLSGDWSKIQKPLVPLQEGHLSKKLPFPSSWKAEEVGMPYCSSAGLIAVPITTDWFSSVKSVFITFQLHSPCLLLSPLLPWLIQKCFSALFTAVPSLCSQIWPSAILVSPVFLVLPDGRTPLLPPFTVDWESNKQQRDEMTWLSPIPLLSVFAVFFWIAALSAHFGQRQ